MDGMLGFLVASVIFAAIGSSLRGVMRSVSLATFAFTALVTGPSKVVDAFNLIAQQPTSPTPTIPAAPTATEPTSPTGTATGSPTVTGSPAATTPASPVPAPTAPTTASPAQTSGQLRAEAGWRDAADLLSTGEAARQAGAEGGPQGDVQAAQASPQSPAPQSPAPQSPAPSPRSPQSPQAPQASPSPQTPVKQPFAEGSDIPPNTTANAPTTANPTYSEPRNPSAPSTPLRALW